MTARYGTLTVALEKNVRADDGEQIIQAIGMIKGVLSVEGNVANADTYLAESRIRHEMGKKILGIVYPERENV